MLIYLPAAVLRAAGIERPPVIGTGQAAGLVLGTAGAALVLSCILAFVFVGHGTQAPFDPPRQLVARGPYGLVRNPMYLGAGLAMAGAALFYQSLALLAYVTVFFVAAMCWSSGTEEPALRRMFGVEYDAYCRRVPRWRPRMSPADRRR